MDNLKLTGRQTQFLLALGVAALILALVYTIAQLAVEAEQVEEAVAKLDLAAYEIAGVIEEAKRITITAAEGSRDT